ncbi:uncharacterized protein F4817DRAFT_336635 [Daldinia loculata]|uniref:uncharacterized protein n=1 Tax=Daldinia loculata TaxID=103429 RepID=UPI0020C53564|nr:uncharacterized protein F4817DRAFT_336635 [Daldinia loculata]KAI1647732.1 hypothetical protein F4817DRAFT_336635 [Daldinia loculata]
MGVPLAWPLALPLALPWAGTAGAAGAARTWLVLGPSSPSSPPSSPSSSSSSSSPSIPSRTSSPSIPSRTSSLSLSSGITIGSLRAFGEVITSQAKARDVEAPSRPPGDSGPWRILRAGDNRKGFSSTRTTFLTSLEVARSCCRSTAICSSKCSLRRPFSSSRVCTLAPISPSRFWILASITPSSRCSRASKSAIIWARFLAAGLEGEGTGVGGGADIIRVGIEGYGKLLEWNHRQIK